MHFITKAITADEQVVVTSNEALQLENVRVPVEAITDDTTLTAEDSGKTYLLDAIGEVITLPAVSAGLNYKFRCTAAVTPSSWTIVAAANVIQGYAAVAYATVPAVDENTISIVTGKAIAGDEVSIFSDGTSWFVSGNGSVAASITFTVA